MSKHGRAHTCRKSCCWTPYSVCGKHGNCGCHLGTDAAQARQDMAEVIALEQARLESVRERKKPPVWKGRR
jgi:hypothetical protein